MPHDKAFTETPGARWDRLEYLFALAVDLPPDVRDSWLRAQCGANEDLRREVVALLAADSGAEGQIAAVIEGAAAAYCLDDVPAGAPDRACHLRGAVHPLTATRLSPVKR